MNETPKHLTAPVLPTFPSVLERVEGERLYKSASRYVSFIFPNGRTAHFKNGAFVTSNAYEIAVLDYEIGMGHPNLSYDPNHKYITAEEKDPMLAVRNKHFAEFLAEQQQQVNPLNDMGTSEQGKLNAASTTTIASIAAGAGPANAALVALKAGLKG